MSSYSRFSRLRAGCGVLTMNTSAHSTRRLRTSPALGDFRSSAIPRLLRLAKCQGYASLACGCGGILWPILQVSPEGGSTLMTSAPKSDKITAALGPAIKLAKSTTLSPEKILLLVIGVSKVVMSISLVAVELRRALFEEGGGALLLVLGSGAEAKIRRLEQQALVLARLQPLVHSGEQTSPPWGRLMRFSSRWPRHALAAPPPARLR